MASQRTSEETAVEQRSLLDPPSEDSSSLPCGRPLFPLQRPDSAGASGNASQNFHPHQVLETLENATKWQDRCRVLEDFHKSLLCIPVTDSRPHMSEVLLILNKLLTDTNFKITLTTLYIIGDLVDRWSSSMMAVVGAVVPGLVEKLSDNKIVIRQTATKIFHKIFMAVVRSSPQYADKLLHSLTNSLAKRSVHLRLELLSVTVMALLVFENGGVHYDREQVLQVMCQAAQDANEKVAAVAMEAIAVLQTYGGDVTSEERIAGLLQGDRGTLSAILARLDRDTLPTVTDEGLVEYPSRSSVNEAPRGSVQEQPELMASGGQNSSLPLKLPNAAMAVGRLGRKMFCLEESSPSSQGAGGLQTQGSQANLRRGSGSQAVPILRRPGSCSDLLEAPAAAQARRPGRLLNSGSSPDVSNVDRCSPTPDLIFEDRHGKPLQRQPALLESPMGVAKQASRNLRSPPCSAMKDRRRVAVQPLRVCFKDDLDFNDFKEEPSTPSIAGSAHKEGSHSPWSNGPIELDAVGGLSPKSKSVLIDCSCEESPNYIPDWKRRPVTRQARTEKRVQPTVRSIESGESTDSQALPPSIEHTSSQLPLLVSEEDSVELKRSRSEPHSCEASPKEESLRPHHRAPEEHAQLDALFRKSDQFLRHQERPKCAATMGFIEPEDASHAEIADKLRLLRRPRQDCRARSQGSNRPVAISRSSAGARSCAQLFDDALEVDQLARAEPLSPTYFADEVQAELPQDVATPSRAGASRLGVRFAGHIRSASAGAEKPASASRKIRDPRLFDSDVPPSPSMLHTRRMSAPSQADLFEAQPDAGSTSSADLHNLRQPRRSSAERMQLGQPARGLRGSSSSSAAPNDGAVQYLSSDELLPFETAPSERWLDDLFRRLSAPSDWIAQFEALTDLRRIARYAPQLLGTHSLRQAVVSVVSQVDSLRSSVAKGALMCLHDLFLTYKRGMDTELELVAPVCLRKASDTNGFLVDEAERTLHAMCQSASEAKGLATLLGLAVDGRAKNPRLRAKSVWCLIMVIQRLGPKVFCVGPIERLVQLLHKLLSDASVEVRNLAKLATTALHSVAATAEDFDRLLDRCLTSADVLKVKQMLATSPAPEGQKADPGNALPRAAAVPNL